MSKKGVVGVAGVHFVVGELSRRGWVALPTIRNTEGIDVLAHKESKSVEIQVKSRMNGRVWIVGKNTENLIAKNLFYVFVNLMHLDTPEYFVIPSEVVAEHVARTHKLSVKDGCKDTNPRDFPYLAYDLEFDLEAYKDKWELLLS
jgi:hypothetical protein